MNTEEDRLRRMKFDTSSLVVDKYGTNSLGSVVQDPEQYKGRLPQPAVEGIMSDPLCWVLPAVQPAAEPAAGKERYWVNLRRVTTGKDYPLPQPVKKLNSCMWEYLGSPPFDVLNPEGDDLDALVKAPEQFSNGLFEETRTVCGERFKLRIVRAPELIVEGCDTAVVYAVSPELPTTWGAYNARPGGDNTPVMLNCAASWLLEQAGFQKVVVGPGGDDDAGDAYAVDADDRSEKKRLRMKDLRFAHNLMHGKAGMNRHLLQGCFTVSEPEVRAGDVTVPMTLRQLRFLRHGLGGGVNYHVKTFGGRSYMACMKGVAGWDVYVQVNMHAPLQHVRLWFGSDAAAVGAYIQAPFPAARPGDSAVRVLACKQAAETLRESLDDAAETLKPINALSPYDWDDATVKGLEGPELQGYLRYMGTDLIMQSVVAEGEGIQRAADMRDSNRAVQHLLAAVRSERRGEGPADLTVQIAVMRTLYRACLGAAREVWEGVADGKKAERRQRFRQALLSSDGIVKRPMSLERARAVLVLQTCVNVAPEMWWERAISVMRGSKRDTIADLCHAVLANGSAWKGLYPESIFGPAKSGSAWQAKVNEVSGMDPDLSAGKLAVATLTDAYVRDQDVWAQAAAYCMLTMDIASVGEFHVAGAERDTATP